MTDIVDSDARSRMMAGIRCKNTKPELAVRKFLHSRGYRYRLHVKGLPGKPDIVLRKYGAVIEINGCFWHGHGCRLFRWPRSRQDFWKKKILGNAERDKRNRVELESLGWRVLTVWECGLKGVGDTAFAALMDDVVDWIEQGADSADLPAVPR